MIFLGGPDQHKRPRGSSFSGIHRLRPLRAIPGNWELRKPFEEGCYLIFMRWTALQLAIINEWGGNDSKDKAKSLFDDVLDWFYNAKGASIAPYEPGSSLAATGAGRRDGAQPLP